MHPLWFFWACWPIHTAQTPMLTHVVACRCYLICHLLNTPEDWRTNSALLSVHVGNALNLLSPPPTRYPGLGCHAACRKYELPRILTYCYFFLLSSRELKMRLLLPALPAFSLAASEVVQRETALNCKAFGQKI